MEDVKKDLNFPADDKLMNDEQKEFTSKIEDNQRRVLKFAAIFPAILGISYLLIALYFKSKGGYKPVILKDETDEALSRSTGTEL